MRRLLMAAALLLLAAAAHANAGLRTPFGDVSVKHLKIGQTYSMFKLVNLPLRVVNTGDQEVTLIIETLPTTPAKLLEGYEGVPNSDWVRVETSTFTLEPNREAATDVIIAIPNDTALLGRRFEAHIWSHTRSLHGSVGVGLESRLLLEIDSTPPTEEELKKKFVDERVANLDFTVLPSENDLGVVPLGRPIDLLKERKVAVKLINPNDQPIDFRMRSIPVWESLINAPEGYTAAFNPQWLTPTKGVVKVEGDSIAQATMTLEIPDEERNRGKHFFFIVSFELLNQKIPTHIYYRLRATTPEADKAKDTAK
ncbi:MAG: hypothetical protein ACHQ49_11540 [Elusimicrobiota bacterium]